jgi:hypothetical protein
MRWARVLPSLRLCSLRGPGALSQSPSLGSPAFSFVGVSPPTPNMVGLSGKKFRVVETSVANCVIIGRQRGGLLSNISAARSTLAASRAPSPRRPPLGKTANPVGADDTDSAARLLGHSDSLGLLLVTPNGGQILRPRARTLAFLRGGTLKTRLKAPLRALLRARELPPRKGS